MDEKLLMKLERIERVVWPAVFLIALGVVLYVAFILPGPNEKLLIAAKNGDIVAVGNLLDKGADVNARNKDNLTPLMLAAQNGHVDVVKALLAKGADVNAKANDNKTAQSRAERGNHPEAAKLLKD
ncbi:MAG: ankyrin repeat domain-containing protein [Deltaproteobacteria bacterium]|nr:ankyrin repeat domain-containing protein [Deltaproteobacteria bacterium]